MPAQVRHDVIVRSNDGVVAGICRSLANRWGVDTGVLRFAVVALTIATCGLFSLAYMAFWLIFPSCEAAQRMVDVNPDCVDSYKYGQRISVLSPCSKRSKSHVDYAHTPPRSPEDAMREKATQQARLKTQTREQQQLSPLVFVALAVGVVVVVAGIGLVVSWVSPVFSPFQFWPLAIVALGILWMVIPSATGYRIEDLMVGFVAFCLGAALTASTTGVYIVHFDMWMAQGWPLLLMALGFLLMWLPTRLNGFALCAMTMVGAFCVVGIAFCSDPGPTLWVVSQQPFAQGIPTIVVR